MDEFKQVLTDKGRLIVKHLSVIQRELEASSLEEVASILDEPNNQRFLGCTDLRMERGKYCWKMGPMFVTNMSGN